MQNHSSWWLNQLYMGIFNYTRNQTAMSLGAGKPGSTRTHCWDWVASCGHWIYPKKSSLIVWQKRIKSEDWPLLYTHMYVCMHVCICTYSKSYIRNSWLRVVWSWFFELYFLTSPFWLSSMVILEHQQEPAHPTYCVCSILPFWVVPPKTPTMSICLPTFTP